MSTEIASKLKEGRSLYVLIPLLILHLMLLSIQIQDPSGMFLFRKWLLLVSAPVLNLSSFASDSVAGFWSGYVWLRGTREENERLRQEVRKLNLRDKSLSEMASENARLRSLLGFKEILPVGSVAARIVGRAPSYMASVAYIDRGSRDGVRLNQPVVGNDGVVGRVVLVSPQSSQVQLITNADAAVGAMIERTRTPGVLAGSGGAMLDLNYIGNTEPVEIHDLVVTSGLDGIFPKGLPLGRVTESRKSNAVFRVVRVGPVADMLHLQEVLVLTTSTPLEGAVDLAPVGLGSAAERER